MMARLSHSLMKFLKEEDGPTAVEYGVQLALVVAVCALTISAIGSKANGTFNQVGTQLGKSAGS
jgi:pilus assembly protein Flp/PilA